MTQFSDELIAKITAYYDTTFGLQISRETAIEYLNSGARLYLAFARSKTPKDECGTGSPATSKGL